MKQKKRIGFAFGSGGAKGLAYIGALQVLEENNISASVVTGSSIGAVVGGFLSAGLSPYLMEEYAKKLKISKLINLEIPSKLGIIGTSKSEKFITKILEEQGLPKDFSKTKIPFGCVATDLLSASPVYLTKGNLVRAIRASISIPIIFKPVETKTKILIDGGPLTRIPVKLAKMLGAEVVIAFDCVGPTMPIEKEKIKSVADTYSRFLTMSDYEVSKPEIAMADYIVNFIQPDVVPTSLEHAEQSILDGRKTMEEFLKNHPEILKM